MQCPAIVRDANVQIGNWLMMIAMDGNILVVTPPDDRRHLVALVHEGVMAVVVKDAVDLVVGLADGSPGLEEPDGHCGRVLGYNPDGLSGVDLSVSKGFEDSDVLRTRRGGHRREAGGNLAR